MWSYVLSFSVGLAGLFIWWCISRQTCDACQRFMVQAAAEGKTALLQCAHVLCNQRGTRSATLNLCFKAAVGARQGDTVKWLLGPAARQPLDASAALRSMLDMLAVRRQGFEAYSDPRGEQIWDVVKKHLHAQNDTLRDFSSLLFREACWGNNVCMARMFLKCATEDERGRDFYVSKRHIRIFSKYRPEIALWLLSLDPSSPLFTACVRTRLALLKEWSPLRHVWACSVVRQASASLGLTAISMRK